MEDGLDGEHCYHHQHGDECGYEDFGDCDDDASDYCVHCECCCTCLGCEYGPRDGLLMFPGGPSEHVLAIDIDRKGTQATP